MNKKPEMSQENDKVKTEIQEEVSAVLEEVQEIDYDLVSSGPLYVDPKHIKPGYVHCFVSDKPGEIEMYTRWGYEIVHDEFNVGTKNASTTTRFGSAVTVQSKCGQLLVLMVIKKEQHEKLMTYRHKKNQEREKALGKIEGIPDHLQQFNGESLGEYKITRR